ncbi:MAG TPA: oxidoreductase [Amycolatopsis sp.]|jgi:NAD(P)-dependent dehydrogenase (short-subunit alcohol dehydrogenase family)|nr:oxidoreductase [Amycolatopsis sp.]
MRSRWTETDIPDQSGRTVLITGANSGLGLRSAKVLAAKGARVVLACRSRARGEAVLRMVPGARLILLDLADLAAVRQAAAQVRELTGDSLDILMNNAGVMATPKAFTEDGFELQFATNHLGHAALTWLLMPALRGGRNARVVTLSSLAARGATRGRGFDLGDPNFRLGRYNPALAYSRSKLANQVFALELDRRLRAAGEDIVSAAAHPGYTTTGLTTAMAHSYANPVLRAGMLAGSRIGDLLAQNVDIGALPQLYAATAPEVNGGDYVGPGGPGGLRGHPTFTAPLTPALDQRTGAELWELTEKLTGVTPDPT